MSQSDVHDRWHGTGGSRHLLTNPATRKRYIKLFIGVILAVVPFIGPPVVTGASTFFVSGSSDMGEHCIGLLLMVCMMILCLFAPTLSGLKVHTSAPRFTVDSSSVMGLNGLMMMWIVTTVITEAWLGFYFFRKQARRRRIARAREQHIRLARLPHPNAVQAPPPPSPPIRSASPLVRPRTPYRHSISSFGSQASSGSSNAPSQRPSTITTVPDLP